MPWTEITRPDYDRRGFRYASDVTGAEWALIRHFMPERAKTGRPRRTSMRCVWNAIRYISATGRRWAMPPKEISPFATVQYHFAQDAGRDVRPANDYRAPFKGLPRDHLGIAGAVIGDQVFPRQPPCNGDDRSVAARLEN